MAQKTHEAITSNSRSMFETFKNNPVPAMMIGVGLAWLFASSRSRNGSARRLSSGTRGVVDAVKDGASEVVDSVEQFAHQATSMFGDASHSAGAAIGEFASKAKSSAVEMAHDSSQAMTQFASKAKSSAVEMAHDSSQAMTRFTEGTSIQAKKFGNRAEQTFADNPLLCGATLALAGAAVGFAIPITNREVEWMGKASEGAMQKAGEFASEAWSHVDVAAREAAKQMNGDAGELS